MSEMKTVSVPRNVLIPALTKARIRCAPHAWARAPVAPRRDGLLGLERRPTLDLCGQRARRLARDRSIQRGRRSRQDVQMPRTSGCRS